MTYLTEYRRGGLLFGGEVQAQSWEEAEAKAPRGHEVIGLLVYRTEVDGLEVAKA